MTAQHGTHSDVHSEQGALRGEHPGRAANPTIKVADLAWLEFQRPDLAGCERFARAFGFTTVCRTADELQLRGTGSGAPRTESVNTKIRLITRVAFGFTSSEEGTISWVGCAAVRSSSAPTVGRVGSGPRCRLLRRLFGELVRDDVDQGPGVQVEQGDQVDVVAADLAGDE